MTKKLHPKTWRAKEHVNKLMEAWLKKNPLIDQSTLINLAVVEYVTRSQELKAVELKGMKKINSDKADETLKKVMKDHKNTMDKLK